MRIESLTLLDDIVQVRLCGRLDLEGTEAIDDEFGRATTSGKARIIVDLSEVTFLASIAIRLLVRAAKTQLNRGGRLILAAPQPTVRQVIEAAGIDQVIELFPNVEAGIASLRN